MLLNKKSESLWTAWDQQDLCACDICTRAAFLCSPHRQVSIFPTFTGASEGVSSAAGLRPQQLCAVCPKFCN